MKVLYDISVLGLGNESNANKAGIYRVVENIAYELAKSKEVQLEFCATEFNYLYTHNACLRYLNSNQLLSSIPFKYSQNKASYYKVINTIRRKIARGVESHHDLALKSNAYKALHKIATYFASISDQVVDQINSTALKNSDIYHATVFEIPNQVRKCRSIEKFLTVYDLIPVLYPQFFDLRPKQKHFISKVLDTLQPDDWAICISESTKNDLCNYKDIDPARVFVSHLAADKDIFYPAKESHKKPDVFQKYDIPDCPYMLGLSTLEPRKNIAHTIRSFLDFVEQEKIHDLRLVLVGAKGWNYQEIFDTLGGKPSLSDRIVFTGYVDDEDLAIIYSHALAFIYMSLYEGFGLPPLEAMSCGIPVITSNTSSLPEVVGDAGIMLMPNDRDQLSQCLLQVYSNHNLREEMSIKSLERSKLFTWKRSCETLIDAYKVAKRS